MTRGALVAIGCWGMVGALAARGVAESADPLSPGSLLLCLLLVLAPTGLALPAGRALGAPGWAIETIIAWATLGYLACYIDPRSLGRGPALALLMPALAGALASPALLVAALLPSVDAHSFHRQGYLLAGTICGLLLLRSIGGLSLLTALPMALVTCFGLALLRAGGAGTVADCSPQLAPLAGGAPVPATVVPAAPAVGRALAIGVPGPTGD